jgi:hypothetical protein
LSLAMIEKQPHKMMDFNIEAKTPPYRDTNRRGKGRMRQSARAFANSVWRVALSPGSAPAAISTILPEQLQ